MRPSSLDERGRHLATSLAIRLLLRLDVRVGGLGGLDVLERLALLVLVVVEILERDLLGRQRRHRFLLVGAEEPGEGARLRHPVELLATAWQAGPRGDELADDDVLLEPEQPVLLAHRRGLGEDARGLLERRGREEGAR